MKAMSDQQDNEASDRGLIVMLVHFVVIAAAVIYFTR